MARDPDPNEGTVQSPHPRSDDNRLEAFKHRLDGQGGVHTAVRQHRGHTGQRAGHRLVPSTQCCISPEVQNGVGDGWGPVVKGLNDNGEAWWRGRLRVSLWSLPHLTCCATPETPHPGAEPPQPAHFCKLLRCRSRESCGFIHGPAGRPSPAHPRQLCPPASHSCSPKSNQIHVTEPQVCTLFPWPQKGAMDFASPLSPSSCANFHLAESLPQRPVPWRLAVPLHFPGSPGIVFAPYSPPGCDSWKGKTRLFQQCWAWPHLLTEQMNTFMDSVSLGKK